MANIKSLIPYPFIVPSKADFELLREQYKQKIKTLLAEYKKFPPSLAKRHSLLIARILSNYLVISLLRKSNRTTLTSFVTNIFSLSSSDLKTFLLLKKNILPLTYLLGVSASLLYKVFKLPNFITTFRTNMRHAYFMISWQIFYKNMKERNPDARDEDILNIFFIKVYDVNPLLNSKIGTIKSLELIVKDIHVFGTIIYNLSTVLFKDRVYHSISDILFLCFFYQHLFTFFTSSYSVVSSTYTLESIFKVLDLERSPPQKQRNLTLLALHPDKKDFMNPPLNQLKMSQTFLNNAPEGWETGDTLYNWVYDIFEKWKNDKGKPIIDTIFNNVMSNEVYYHMKKNFHKYSLIYEKEREMHVYNTEFCHLLRDIFTKCNLENDPQVIWNIKCVDEYLSEQKEK